MIYNLSNGIRICTVDVPDYPAHLYVGNIRPTLMYWDGKELKEHPLPEGEWKILGRFDEITEEMWKGIMESKRIKKAWDDRLSTIYKNYGAPMFDWHDGYIDTATESARSLIPDNPVVLIEKK